MSLKVLMKRQPDQDTPTHYCYVGGNKKQELFCVWVRRLKDTITESPTSMDVLFEFVQGKTK